MKGNVVATTREWLAWLAKTPHGAKPFDHITLNKKTGELRVNLTAHQYIDFIVGEKPVTFKVSGSVVDYTPLVETICYFYREGLFRVK